MDAPDMNFWLGRKYALLQQQADAGTQNANTAAMTGKAAARVDNTRADLMPAESAASIAKSRAETGLLGQQTQWFGPEARARISNLGAQTRYTGIQADVLKKEGLDEIPTTDASYGLIRGMRLPAMGAYSGYRLGGVLGN